MASNSNKRVSSRSKNYMPRVSVRLSNTAPQVMHHKKRFSTKSHHLNFNTNQGSSNQLKSGDRNNLNPKYSSAKKNFKNFIK